VARKRIEEPEKTSLLLRQKWRRVYAEQTGKGQMAEGV
jgi:hypothetical protein